MGQRVTGLIGFLGLVGFIGFTWLAGFTGSRVQATSRRFTRPLPKTRCVQKTRVEGLGC